MINISVPLLTTLYGGGIQYISSRTKYTIEGPREKPSSPTEQMTSAIMTIVVNESMTS